MALADYRLCDVCSGKAFYDANLSYEEGEDGDRKPYFVAGQPQYTEVELDKKYGMRLGYVGDWAVICDDCSKTHYTQIVKRNEGESVDPKKDSLS